MTASKPSWPGKPRISINFSTLEGERPMLTLHIEAETYPQLRTKVLAALDMMLPREVAAAAAIADADPPSEPKRPVGRPRKVQPDPVPEIDPDPKPGWVRLGPDRQPEAVDDVDIGGMPSPDQHDDYREPNGADPDPIALEKLKQETVAKLPDMFAAGKVNLMRAVLTKY